jgi:hypothetical protein
MEDINNYLNTTELTNFKQDELASILSTIANEAVE